ncbi:uncharacterized protein LOC127005899 isoform X2 [Eriocheir sinensis]|nr:uncharacterized protein LOC127005899 isoform X2 [Eriocheir sinensis]
MTLFEVALKHYPQSSDLHHLLAGTLYRFGSTHEAWNHACLAQMGCPRDPCAQELQGRLANSLVDRWHLPMLNDAGRNTAFKQAITRAVREGHLTVLDIGSGTGLLSIYALKAGAQEIFACEVDKFMCEMSSSILQMNVDPSSISILNKHSKDIHIPSDIPKKVSMVVTETVDAGLFGEHILSTLQHAWQHLLIPPSRSHDDGPANGISESQFLCNGRTSITSSEANSLAESDVNVAEEKHSSAKYGKVIPSRAEVFVALISCSYIAKQTKYLNPDIECLKNKSVSVKLEEPYMSEKLSHIPGGFKLLSEWLQVTCVDFNSLKDITRHITGEVNKPFTLRCTDNGPVDAIALAFNLHLDDENCIRTFPNSLMETVWENAVYPVVHPLNVISDDTITLDFKCCDIIQVVVQDKSPLCPSSLDSIKLNTHALRFLNSKSFVDTYKSAAQQVFNKIQQCRKESKDTHDHPIVICDTLPFPVGGLCLQSYLPDSQLYVEDVDIQAVLQEMGISAGLTEEIADETLDVLFLWPVTQEGTLADGIIEKVEMYRQLMANGGLVFPQELELVMDVVSSPVLAAATQVSDANTSGVAVAEVFNMMQTTHQLDVTLASLPHTTSVLRGAVPVLRVSLVSGRAEAVVEPQEPLPRQGSSTGMLVLGGEVVEARTRLAVTQSTTLAAIPYWFHFKGGLEQAFEGSSSAAAHSESDSILSTLGEDSPCNQSVFMLKEPLEVVAGEKVTLRVVWREGVFTASLERHESFSTEGHRKHSCSPDKAEGMLM